MADKITYKGFEIEANPYSRDPSGWTHDGHIYDHRDDGVTETQIVGKGWSEEREKAVEAVHAAGKRIVDSWS